MASSTATPKLMHFPMAVRLAMQGWRIRRSTWSAVPSLLTNLTDEVGNTASLTLFPGVRKLAWLEYRAGLWYITTWQEVPSGGLGEWVKTTIPRVVESADMTAADYLAEDWTMYDIGCDLSKSDDCACAALDALAKVPSYPVSAVGEEDIEGELDLWHGNARMGVTGCDIDTSGECSCAPATSTSGGGGDTTGTDGDKDLSGGGAGDTSTDGESGGGSGLAFGGGTPSGGNRRPPRPRPAPREVSESSVSVEVSCSQTECYNLTDYGLSEAGAVLLDPPPSFDGSFTLTAAADAVLWFYTITFRGRVVDSGLLAAGDTIGFDLGPQTDAQPGQSWPVVVNCSKPGVPADAAAGNATAAVPPWCTPSRSRSRERAPAPPRRPEPPERPRSRRTPDERRPRRREERRPRRPAERRPARRRPDDRRPPVGRRPDPPRRPTRRPPPSYGISVSISADRTTCYEESDIVGGFVPLITFSGDFSISASEGTWSYSVVFRGETVASGTCAGGESVSIANQLVADATAGSTAACSVHADRIDGEGSADGSALGNVPAMCTECTGEHETLNTVTNTCDCDSGYYRDESGACVAEPSCGAHQHVDPSTHTCVCDEGYHDEGGTCVADPTCGAHQHVDSGTHECVCDEGYELDGSDCVIICSGEHSHRSGDACVCDEGYHDESGVCVADPTCGDHETLNPSTHLCECESGYYRNESDACVPEPTCGAHSHLAGHVCVCDDGYVLDGEECVLPACEPGYHRDEFGVCVPDE